jgi:3'-5' exoribonuclease
VEQPELITAAMPERVEAARSEPGPARPEPEPACAKQFVRDLGDGEVVDSVFVVRDRSRRRKRSGEDFLKLKLGDVTGAVEAVVWDGVEQAWGVARLGAVVRVGGTHAIDARYGATLTVKAVREAAASEYEAADLLEGPVASYERMVADLRSLIETVREPHLSQLLERIFGEESAIWQRWRLAPAAKYYHQAYRHGLLEHSLSVAQGVSAISATFPAIDRDVAVTGALLHDIGKIEAYAIDGGAIEMTDAGRLQGEIPLGYYIVRREIESIRGFPEALAEAVLHIVLSHHGKLEHGSPVVPCTREATLVHMIDNLGGTLGSFDRIEKTLQSGERWSAFDRALSASAYFPSQAA